MQRSFAGARYVILTVVMLMMATPAWPATSKGKPAAGGAMIAVLSKSNLASLSSGKKLELDPKAVDAELREQITAMLQKRNLNAFIAESETGLAGKQYDYILTYSLEKIEEGPVNIIGKSARFIVNTVLTQKDGKIIKTRKFEGHSVLDWKDSAKSAAKRVAKSVYLTLEGKDSTEKDDADDDQPASAANESKIEERLKQLEALKAKGLITDEEYARKRAEILKDL